MNKLFPLALLLSMVAASAAAQDNVCLYAGLTYTQGAVIRSSAGTAQRCVTAGEAGGLVVGGDAHLVWADYKSAPPRPRTNAKAQQVSPTR